MNHFCVLMTLTFGATLSTNIVFNPGPPSQSSSTLIANPNAAVANGSAVISLTFTAKDAYSNLVSGAPVALSASGGNNVFGAASGTTNPNGTFSTTLASTLAQSESVTASFNSATVTTTVQFTAGPPAASTSSLSASPNNAIANNSNTILAQLTLRDANGNPLTNAAPTFAASGSSTTISTLAAAPALGQYSATYQSALAQNENVQVTASGLSFAAPIVFVAGPVAQATSSLVASPNTLPANGATTTALTTTARDAQGNAVANVAVGLAASGSSNTFGATNGNTTTAGAFTTTLSSTLAQSETITATLNGNITESTTVAFAQVANATTSTLTTSPTSAVVGPTNGNGIIATLTLRDPQSNPIPNIAPTWTATGAMTDIVPSGNTNASGVATATYTSTLVQNENTNVSAGGITLSAALTFVAGSPNTLNSVVYDRPARQVANNSNVIAVYALLRDDFGNVVPNRAAVFSASGSSTTIVSNGNTNTSGITSATYRTSVVQNENAIVTSGGASLVQPLSFTSSPSVCTLSASTASATADGNTPIILTATVRGGSNKTTPNVLVSFVTSGGPASFSPPNAVTNASGVVTTNVTSFFAGPRKLFASTNGIQCTAQGNFLTRAPFCASSPNFTVTNLTSSCPSVSTAIGDLNQDGNQDIVIYTRCGILHVFLSSGNGTFSAPASYATGSNVSFNSMVLADFNADGNLDVAISNNSVANVGVFLGSSSGQLGTQQIFPVETINIALTAGDVDGDGAVDLVVGSRAASTINVLFGTNTGQFLPYISYPSNQSVNQSVAIGDFNNDGINDLLTSNVSGTTPICSVILGSLPGTFKAPTAYPMSSVTVSSACVGDFNIDGNLDFAGRNNSNPNIDIYPGVGNGNFLTKTSPTSAGNSQSITAEDLNGDGYPDIILPEGSNSTISLLLGTQSGTFTSYINIPNSIANFTPRQIAVADFNNDNRRDFVVTNFGSNTSLVFISSGCN